MQWCNILRVFKSYMMYGHQDIRCAAACCSIWWNIWNVQSLCLIPPFLFILSLFLFCRLEIANLKWGETQICINCWYDFHSQAKTVLGLIWISFIDDIRQSWCLDCPPSFGSVIFPVCNFNTLLGWPWTRSAFKIQIQPRS